MNDSINQHGINRMLVAINREMSRYGEKTHPDADTIFMGGAEPDEAHQASLADFALKKNYKLIFCSFDPRNVAGGPVGVHAVVTDGIEKTIILSDGRLWKRDRRSPAVLVFASLNAVVRMSTKGRLIVREMSGSYHEEGYAIALEAVRATAGSIPTRVPVVSMIGDLAMVMDVEALMATCQAA